MAPKSFLVSALLVGLVAAQTPGKTPENHPKLTTYKCTVRGGCKSQKSSVVIDSSNHNIHQKSNVNAGCTNGTLPDSSVCPDQATCAKNCIIEGVSDYTKLGVYTSGDNLRLDMLDKSGKSLSPRVYLLDQGGQKYEMLKLLGNEFAFDVDSSKLPCGMNSALYLSEMEDDGGKSKYNQAGAAYGTGYCDAQCFTTPFINGAANVGGKGACCNEMDVWEANARATQVAPHVCSKPGVYQCTGAECAFNGTCDKNGCGYNTYGQNQKNFYGYGKGFTVDTSRKFSVITQFPAKNGVLQSINRLYVQDGRVIQEASVNVAGSPVFGQNKITDPYCDATGAVRYEEIGGNEVMGDALGRGMVLIFSIWWDQGGFMNWLDSGNAGPCNATEGNPAVITQVEKFPTVTFSNVKWGEIGSTYCK